MVFSDSTDKQGIVEKVHFLLGSDSNVYSIEDITREANQALDKVVGLILASDNTFQFDGTNYTDLPIATTDLVSGQTDYSFDAEHLRVIRVEAQDEAGNWLKLKHFDPRNTKLAMKEFHDQTGVPRYYDLLGNQIFLYPASNFNKTAGLRLFFNRKMEHFVKTDTTKLPGFAATYHDYIPFFIAWQYTLSRTELQAKGDRFKMRLDDIEKGILKHYAKRNEDNPPKITARRVRSI